MKPWKTQRDASWDVAHFFLTASETGINTASTPADRAQANQGVGKVLKLNLKSLDATLLLENLGRHCREWQAGKTDSKIKFLINKNSKAQDPVNTVGSVTKDQSGWGFTVKQGTTTIHKDSVAYTVSNSSSLMEVGAVTLCTPLDWLCPTR